MAAPTTEQGATTARYDRMARWYDLYDAPMDLLGVRRRRRELVSRASGRTLEVGVGTGRNLTYYGSNVDLVAIDVSSKMLERARRVAADLDRPIALRLADVHDLPFGDDEFDTAVATSVFCSVADPVRGLREIARVVRPDGRILLLEHVRPRTRLLGRLADLLNPIVKRMLGPEINRRTEQNIDRAGLRVEHIERWGVWRQIIARPA